MSSTHETMMIAVQALPPARPVLLVAADAEQATLLSVELQVEHVANVVDYVTDVNDALDYVQGRGRHASRRRDAAPILVLVEVHLPDMASLEALHVLRSNERLCQVPALAVTATQHDEELLRACHLDVDGFVRRPVHVSALAEAIRHSEVFWLLTDLRPPG
jgi:CheY-like chemotaxis protein